MKNLICVLLAICAMLLCGAVQACPPVAAPVGVQSLGVPAVVCPQDVVQQGVVGVQSLGVQSYGVQSFGVQSFAPVAFNQLSLLGQPVVLQNLATPVIVRQRHVQRSSFLNGLGFTNGFRNASANILGVRGSGRGFSFQRSVNIQRIR